MKYLSNPAEELQPAYEIVVIGSGYGGGIAASRLSRAGRQVCVLERGREFQPGEYPDTLIGATEEMQVHTAGGHKGSPTGLYDLHVHPGISVLVGCGLGGTSLINANVSIRPEERVFDDPNWPRQIRDEFKNPESLLNKGYSLAMDMLRAAPLPDSIQLNKLKGLETSAKALNEKFYRTNINVNFEVDGINHAGVEQKPCNLCGDCCSGCNVGAKNTLIMNYLPDAKAHGAKIFTQTWVSHIEKRGNKWLVYYSITSSGQEKFDAPDQYVEADMVILSAGTLGSNEILLRSKQKGLKVSDRVGYEFSGNGDVLGFAYNTEKHIDGVGEGTHTLDDEKKPGPCITGVIDMRYKDNLNDGMIIEDAAVPGAIGSLLPLAIDVENKIIGERERQDKDKGFINRLKHEYETCDSDIRGPYFGAIRNTQTYLLMTHDGEHGKMTLNNNRLSIDWSTVGKELIFRKANDKLAEATKALSGVYVKNPVWVKEMNNELVTVHPLGGCTMGDSIETAVVNHKGQVYSGDSDTGVFENFYITDGSVMPRSLGVNPLLTISAVSERCCALIAADRNWTIDYDSKKILTVPEVAKKVGVQFTETMKGFYSKGISNNDYQAGLEKGTESNESLQFTLTISSTDVYSMIDNPDHSAEMSGTVTAPGLSTAPLTVSSGVFNLFVDDPDTVDTKLMKYAMCLNSEEGKQYYFKGFKFVHHDRGLDEWPDTSTLYITLFDGPDDKSPVLGQGILHIEMADFSRQMKTMKAINASSVEEGLKAIAAFGNYFSKQLFEVYGGIFAPNHFDNPDAKPRKKRELRLCDPEYYPIKTKDGVELLLTRYNGGGSPLLMVHGFSGNRLTFAIDTIDTNMAEFFFAYGFDVWLFDYRLSNLLPSSKSQHTVDEIAMYDYPEAVNKIRAVTGAAQIDVMAHCVGSISLFMALLNGMEGVRSVISAQIASDFYPAPQVKWKAGLHIPQVLDALGIHSLSAYADSNEGWLSKLYDKFLEMYAVPVAGYCNNPTCHRMTFMFGPLYEHSQLNDATHTAMIEMFSIANMRTYEHLTKMIRAHHLLTADGQDIYMPNLKRLALPVTFIHGEKNQVFDPESTLTTYNKLCETNGKDLYQRHVISGYGHNDCMYGKNAAGDVFPLILKHLAQVSNQRARS
ncbi:MAG: GMC family oxidoreductase N-terminal domain-containing protein [Bacteroidetes bacterium]|nr:GMC family oxidoreductase N-terminal domain-containing protein [Bacteroidota bacterium]